MSSDVLRLLVLVDSLEDADHLMRDLRNAGMATRPSTAESLDEIETIISKQQLDLVLIDSSLGDELSVDAVAEKIAVSGKDLPLIALIDDFSIEASVEAMAAGATSGIPADNSDMLVKIVEREFAQQDQRRRLRFLEASLNESERRISALLDSSRDAIAYVHEGMHVYANPAYLEMFEYDDFEELEGLPVLDMVTAEHAKELKDVLRGLSKGESPPEHIEIGLQMPDGDTKSAMMEFSSASVEGEPVTQIVLRDKTMDSATAAELRDLKNRDLVTGLYNRPYMVTLLDQAITKLANGGDKRTVLLVSIDNFRGIQDQVGLAGLDVVLRDYATLVTDVVGDQGESGRFGDQNFTVLLNTGDLSEAEAVGEKIRAAIDGHLCDAGGQAVSTTCSVGVTVMSESISRARDLLALANGAAQSAQEAGGNKVQAFDPLQSKPDDDASMRWIDIVRDAREADRLYIAYQPIVSLHGESGERYECYLRGKTKEGEEMKPGEFIKAIRDHEIMIDLDHWMIEQATHTMREHLDKKPDIVGTFFIKLAPQSIAHPKTLPLIAKALQTSRLSGENLVFEMSETSLMTNLKPAKAFVKGLQQLHCKFCIEQFGSGLNSSQMLKHIEADWIKIDRTFVADLAKNTDNQNKIKEICTDMQGRGKTTIVEFVEDAASMSILWQCGAQFVQGNFLQEPLPSLDYEFE